MLTLAMTSEFLAESLFYWLSYSKQLLNRAVLSQMGYEGKGCLEIEQESLFVCRVGKFGGIGILLSTNYVNVWFNISPSLASIVKQFQSILKNREISYYDLMVVSYNH